MLKLSSFDNSSVSTCDIQISLSPHWIVLNFWTLHSRNFYNNILRLENWQASKGIWLNFDFSELYVGHFDWVSRRLIIRKNTLICYEYSSTDCADCGWGLNAGAAVWFNKKKKKPANKCLAHMNDGTDSFQRTWFDDILMG